MRILIVGLSLLWLTGCEQMLINYAQDLQNIQQNRRQMMQDNAETRKWIRDDCREGLETRVEKLRKKGKHDEADSLLVGRYPPSIAGKAAKEGLRSAVADINVPYICGGKDGG